MADDPANGNSSSPRSWLARLGLGLLGEPRDREELIELIREAQSRGVLDADAVAMIEGALEVAEMQVRDVMVPRGQMVVVPRDASPEEILPIIVESGHSRFPVIGDDRDEVVGLLLAKDMLRYFAGSRAAFNIQNYLRKVAFIPESRRLNMLLKDFRSSRNHMALVVDEYGGIAGLVTIEDVLEQIVGDIDDEHDTAEEGYIHQHDEHRYTVKALTPIEDFNEYFGTDFDDSDFDTIGGLIMGEFGHLPRRGEAVDISGMRFRVLRADNRRVHLLELRTGAKALGAPQP